MSFLYFLTVFAGALAAIALLGGVVTIVSHAVRGRLERRRRVKRAEFFEWIVQGLEAADWDPQLIRALHRNRPLGADLACEMSELIRGENREKVLDLCRRAGIDGWLLGQLSSFSHERRRFAAETLRLFPGEETTRALNSALNDQSGDIRLAAALSLAELGALPPLPVLVTKLAEIADIQSLLFHRLMEDIAISRPDEVMELGKGAMGRPFLRPIALRALAAAGHLEMGGPIAAYIEDSDPEVRAAALDAVASLGFFGANDRIRQALADPIDFVRVRAVEATRRLELRELTSELIGLLDDPNWWVRFRSGETLASFGHRLSERERRILEFAPAERGAA